MGSSESEKRSRRAHLDTLWKAAEVRHHTSVPPEARGYHEESMHLTDPALYPDEVMSAGAIDWFVEDGLPAWERHYPAGGPDAALQRSRTGPAAPRSTRPRVYGKTLAQRLRLLSFVAERAIPVAGRGVPGFDTSGRPIPWEQVHAEWKKENPDYRGSAEALERAYRRAKSDRRVCELYFDDEFRNWAKQAEDVRHILNWLGMAGLRLEDVFVQFVTTDGNYEPDTRGLPPDMASAIRRVASYKKWARISIKLPPARGRAFERAVRDSCGLTVDHWVAYPRDEQFCEGPHCRRCKVGADLVKVGFARQEDLREVTAAGAGARHRRRLDESAQNWRKLLDLASGRPRGS